MKVAPTFFEPIRHETAQLWDQLEGNPVLAGPWRQLFEQVQSPRHVLSELLQNADDAGATEASARVEDQAFVFEHNGEDFTEEHLASLCRFGYSNKRALHTIGFRGVGFKSTFSLGDLVELYTPTLSISFDYKRFTEPRWLLSGPDTGGKTRFRVAIKDEHRQRDVESNLREWLESPVSLLFFKNIRRMSIGECIVHWNHTEPGPIPNSDWVALDGDREPTFLLLRSDAESFPNEAIREIREARTLGMGEEYELPPCKVEIVLGAAGRLFVVLPTGVKTNLPFACNAPFIQDPARVNVKEPGTSATNRWLLERAGKLAGAAMLQWLEQRDLSAGQRARAYSLLPVPSADNTSLEGSCGGIVRTAFRGAIEGQRLLLTDNGAVVKAGAAVVLPSPLFEVWPTEPIAATFDVRGRPPLNRNVSTSNSRRLCDWRLAEEILRTHIAATLRKNSLPNPATWQQLIQLWAYLAPEVD